MGAVVSQSGGRSGGQAFWVPPRRDDVNTCVRSFSMYIPRKIM